MEPHIKEKMNNRIRKVMKERTGPSFEERVAVRAAKLSKETREIENVQAKTIEAAVSRARARPTESPVRPKHLTPPSIEEMGKQHAQTRRENESRYAQDHAARKNRMDTREPLFRLSAVAAAFDMQEQRKKDHRKELTEDENRRWDHLQELQEHVLDRPLLMEDPAGAAMHKASPSADEADQAQQEKDPNWKVKFQAKMTKRIQQTIHERSGPSFEERVQARSLKFRKETKTIEDSQKRVIEAAVERAKARPSESPFRPKDMYPPTIEDWGREHQRIRAENESGYAQKQLESKKRMDAREPLFRVSEVQAAFEMQQQRQKDHQRKLRKDEQECWAMLNSMQERVVDRPLLVESYERPIHSKSETELRSIPNHTKTPQSEEIVKKCVSQPWFLESAWGKEVSALKERMNNRQKLHEISYPPKVIPEKPPPQKILTDLDKRLHQCINQGWYKKSQWASEVKDIQQRQHDRVPLSQIKYPPKEH